MADLFDTSGAVERQKQCFVCRGEGRHRVAEVLNGKSPGPIYGGCSECGSTGLIVEPATWDDLDAFTQGYVEALIRDSYDALDRQGMADPDGPSDWGFRHLSPEALAMILADCAAIHEDKWAGYGWGEADGALFWRERQSNQLNGMDPKFPPLTVSLGDDGKIPANPRIAPLTAGRCGARAGDQSD